MYIIVVCKPLVNSFPNFNIGQVPEYIYSVSFLFTVDGGTSASLSSLQGVVTSSQIMRNQGPSLTPSLANYVRADLIAHVTNWPAEVLEKQVCTKHTSIVESTAEIQALIIFSFIFIPGANSVRRS